MTLTYTSLFLLVVIRKNLTLTLLECHEIFSQLFIMDKFHLKRQKVLKKTLETKIEELKYNYKPKNEKEKKKK